MIRIFGLLLSVKEFKKVDKMCCEMLERMTLSQIVRMFGICCQLRKKGEFISNAQNTLIEQRANLSNKDLLLTSALFL